MISKHQILLQFSSNNVFILFNNVVLPSPHSPSIPIENEWDFFSNKINYMFSMFEKVLYQDHIMAVQADTRLISMEELDYKYEALNSKSYESFEDIMYAVIE